MTDTTAEKPLVSDTETTKESADEIKSTKKETREHKPAKEHKPKEQCVAILQRNPLYSEASRVLHWRDPVRSGLIFGIISFVYFLLSFGDYSIVTLTSYLLLTLLIAAFGYSQAIQLRATWLQGKKAENPLVALCGQEDCHITKQQAEKHLETVLDLTNLTFDHLKEVFLVTDIALSLKWAVAFYVLASVGNWFSGLTLAYLVTLGLFVWPRLYEEKHTEIDQYYGLAVHHASIYLDQAHTFIVAKIPPHIAAKIPHLKPKST